MVHFLLFQSRAFGVTTETNEFKSRVNPRPAVAFLWCVCGHGGGVKDGRSVMVSHQVFTHAYPTGFGFLQPTICEFESRVNTERVDLE